MEKLQIKENMGKEEMRYAVEAARLLGFQTEAAVFPVTCTEGGILSPQNEDELQELWALSEKGAPDGYLQAKGNPEPMFDLEFREQTGLEYIFSKGPFLKDEDFDFLPDKLDVKLVLPDNADHFLVASACNIAFRLGMETTGYEGDIVAEEGYKGNAFVFENAAKTEMVLEESEKAVRVIVRGQGQELLDFTAYICEHFPSAAGFQNWRDVLMNMTDDFILRGADGQLAALDACGEEDEENTFTVYGSPEITEQQKSGFPRAVFENYKAGRQVYEKTYTLPWEVETFERILEEELYPKLRNGDRIRIQGAVSEDLEVREKLKAKIQEKVKEKGAETENLDIFCAYKQGFSWLDEKIIPSVRSSKSDKIEIFFKPFLPKGQKEWLDENGATPSYHNLKADNPDKWYDLPIRYLQELYPIEDVLVRELGLSRDDVVFLPYEGEEDITYRCKVYCGDEICLEETYRAWYSERPYMDEYPQMGKVHPSTGYITVSINGEESLSRRVRTDLEEIWDTYQAEVLPDCRKYIEEKYDGKITEDLQPFFQELLLDVTVSEPDYRVGCREDLISSLDALHEDMYFAGSDYFKNYGVQNINVMLDAPGLILPAIHKKEGPPVFRVVLSEKLTEKPCIVRNDEILCGQRERGEVSAWITRIAWEDSRPLVEIQTGCVADALLASYANLLQKGILHLSEELTYTGKIVFVSENGSKYESSIRGKKKCSKEKRIEDINLHEKELIGYDMYRSIIEELKEVPGIEVFRTARSYTGRELYAIWIRPDKEGYISMTKRLTLHPSEIINARHHANEVSSTNASFILLRKLLTKEEYKELPEKLNLILVPMENVDGAAIHYELQKEHPFWKFHVARFNSLGKEFFSDHFRKDTIHSEAMGLSRLYERYVPDMIVDNHGVPSHEWEQQFSGYTSPSYKGFWLPRSLLYGYFWYVTDEAYKDNYPVNKEMEDVIADEIAKDGEMTALNKEWSKQFEKYAHAWMPKLFPADYYKNMINYWIPYKADPGHKYPSIRFPWITTVSYTSEVADETAQGDYLNLCARAHVAHDEATLRMLMCAKTPTECSFDCMGGRTLARYKRRRPMIIR